MIVSCFIQWSFLDRYIHSNKWQPCSWWTGNSVTKWLWPISGQYSRVCWPFFRILKG